MWGEKNLSSEAAFPGKRLVLIRGCFTNGIFFLPLMSLSFIPEDSAIDRAGACVWWMDYRQTTTSQNSSCHTCWGNWLLFKPDAACPAGLVWSSTCSNHNQPRALNSTHIFSPLHKTILKKLCTIRYGSSDWHQSFYCLWWIRWPGTLKYED